MSVSVTTTQEFRVGSVLGQAFSVLSKNIVPFGLLSLLIMSPTYIYALVFDPEIYMQTSEGTTEITFSASESGIGIVETLLSYFLTAALVYGTVQELRGRRASLGDCVSRGLSLILPVFVVAILVGLSVGIASLLLIVPGLIVMTMLWVAIPAAVIERPGVIASLSRSAELTKGYRWQIFGIIVLIFVFAFVALFVVAMVIMGVGNQTVIILGQLVVTAIITSFGAVVSAVGYYNLRVVQEGVDVEEIAAVFD